MLCVCVCPYMWLCGYVSLYVISVIMCVFGVPQLT